MFRLSSLRPALLLALVLLLAAPWETAAGSRLGNPQRRAAFSESTTPDVFSGFLRFFARLWEKAGCIIDPNGRCVPIQVDNGCGLDPDGECASTQVDAGCGIDPHGGCVGG